MEKRCRIYGRLEENSRLLKSKLTIDRLDDVGRAGGRWEEVADQVFQSETQGRPPRERWRMRHLHAGGS